MKTQTLTASASNEGSVNLNLNARTYQTWFKPADSNEFVLQTVIRPARVVQSPMSPLPSPVKSGEGFDIKDSLQTGAALAGIIAIPLISTALAAAGMGEASFAFLAFGGTLGGLICLRNHIK